MATSTLVRVPSDDAASLALREKGIDITEQFWMTPSEPHWRVLGLVSPERDAPEGYALYGKIFAALEGFPYADRDFIGGRMMVFGEKKIEKELDMIHAGFTKLSEIGPYTDVEISPIPRASDIRKSLLVHFMPNDSPGAWYRMFYHPLDRDGAVPWKDIRSESELLSVLRSLRLAAGDQDRILRSLERQEGTETVVYYIGLDTLYRLNLV